LYTIQEAKQKAEKDRELMAAEVKRQVTNKPSCVSESLMAFFQVTRDQIHELREIFVSLVHQNENAQPEFRVPKECFEVDFGLEEEIG
jgi:hypothetical protein